MVYILLAMVAYTAAILLSTFASRLINSNIVTAVVNVVSVFIPLAIVIPMISKKIIADSRTGILIAVLAGVAIAVFTLSINRSFALNKVGIVTPIVFGGAIFLSTILGSMIFKEKISLLQGTGLAFMGVGLLIIIYVKATGN